MSTSPSSPSYIHIKGAKEHNLKNLSLSLPKGQLIVLTGPSGCGKSSLAYHTLYAEGQRRYLESLSAHSRQYLPTLPKPDVESIEGLCPALALEQQNGNQNPRSLLATATEIYEYLRILYASSGVAYDPETGEKLIKLGPAEILSSLMSSPPSSRLALLAPLPASSWEEASFLLKELERQGFLRFFYDGQLGESPEILALLEKTHPTPDKRLFVVVDRLVVRPEGESRLADSLEMAFRLSPDEILVLREQKTPEGSLLPQEELAFFTRYRNPETGFVLEDLTPKHFSFNSPLGACPRCHGLGEISLFEPKDFILAPTKSLWAGALATWHTKAEQAEKALLFQNLSPIIEAHGLSSGLPWQELPPEIQEEVLSALALCAQNPETGPQTKAQQNHFKKLSHTGLCPSCQGVRLNPLALSLKLEAPPFDDLNIARVLALSVQEAYEWSLALQLVPLYAKACEEPLRQLRTRLRFLLELGLGYLHLNRPVSSLSGGEAQRIKLATQLGGGLSGVLYVLDEPTIGLHASETQKLIQALHSLKEAGNTLLVVEHDAALMQAADLILDMGPGAGEKGGQLLASGTSKTLAQCPNSPTGDWLSGRQSMPAFPRKSLSSDSPSLLLQGARQHNLKNIDLWLPLGAFVCLTGPSGSGKSTLVNDILYPALSQKFFRSKTKAGGYDALLGTEALQRVIYLDQSPIGRSPRSTPASYSGILDSLRSLFAQLPLSKQRGYSSARFSPNKRGGRCEKCAGMGIIELPMHFLAQSFIPCDSCQGKRYNRETLEVTWKGKNIAELLHLPVKEALLFFKDIPTLQRPLRLLFDLGLGYLPLDQAAPTLSGGEAQRLKLATELHKRQTLPTLYLLDEPTTGLHFSDIARLLKALFALREEGHSVLCIEHHPDVLACADWMIELGPTGGDQGGFITYEGPPRSI